MGARSEVRVVTSTLLPTHGGRALREEPTTTSIPVRSYRKWKVRQPNASRVRAKRGRLEPRSLVAASGINTEVNACSPHHAAYLSSCGRLMQTTHRPSGAQSKSVGGWFGK